MITPIIGIDLGTTNTVVSYLQNSIPQILTNHLNAKTTPSLVSYNPKLLVGAPSKQQDEVISSVKRLIGQKYSEKHKQIPYAYENVNGDVWIKTAGKKLSPIEVSSDILKYVKQSADKFFGKEVKEAVITVPAYFNDLQRQATKDAGRLAGLNVLRVVNEPTAAALAYGLDKSVDATIAVYDLGGGTFDVSILEIKDGIFEVLSTNGNTELGGDDIDDAICNAISTRFEKENKVKLDYEAKQRLKEQIERAKKILSCKQNTRLFVPNVCTVDNKPVSIDYEISRNEIELIANEIVDKTIEPCKKAMRDAKLKPNDIKHVILVGGATRMPLVRKTVEKIFEKVPDSSINPDEVVAKGAAIQAGILKGVMNDIILLDVTSLSLGIETVGGIFSEIIRRNTTIPTKQTQVFTTSEDNQTDVEINIYQGERKLVKHNKHLGKINIAGITRMKKGEPRIEITFESDANGIYKVTAKDLILNKAQTLEINPSSGLKEEEIQKIIQDAKKNEETDKKIIECNEFRNEIEKMKKEINNKELLIMLENEIFDIQKAQAIVNEHINKQ